MSVTPFGGAGPAAHGASQDGAAADAPGARAALRYLLAVVLGLAGSLAAFYGVLFALERSGNLPPPAFSNSLCVDEKLRHTREHRPVSPDLLVIGSSVAWRHVDGAVLSGATGTNPFNAGFCGIHANQVAHVANWLLAHMPSVRQVVMIASPQDFAACRRKPAAAFDLDDATRYVYQGASSWPYYMRYFSPVSLLRNARSIKDKRSNRLELDSLLFTTFGDGPLDTQLSRPTLVYGAPEPLDAACFDALTALATRLQREGRPLLVVTTPIHPQWKAAYDPDGSFLARFDAGLRQAVQATGTRVWDAAREWTRPPGAFTDAIHLRWSEVGDFSAALARRLAAPGARPQTQPPAASGMPVDAGAPK